MAARCCWTKFRKSISACRPSCFACCRKRRSNASARARPFASMSASWPRRIAICGKKSRRAAFARICIIGWPSCRFTCRRFASAAKTSPSFAITSSPVRQVASARALHARGRGAAVAFGLPLAGQCAGIGEYRNQSERPQFRQTVRRRRTSPLADRIPAGAKHQDERGIAGREFGGNGTQAHREHTRAVWRPSGESRRGAGHRFANPVRQAPAVWLCPPRKMFFQGGMNDCLSGAIPTLSVGLLETRKAATYPRERGHGTEHMERSRVNRQFLPIGKRKKRR